MGYCMGMNGTQGCGRFFMAPAPHKCPRCGGIVAGGCAEGDMYQLTKIRNPGDGIFHVGGRVGQLTSGVFVPKVIEVLPVHDAFGDMRIEFLSYNNSPVANWRTLHSDDDRDTSMAPGIRK